MKVKTIQTLLGPHKSGVTTAMNDVRLTRAEHNQPHYSSFIHSGVWDENCWERCKKGLLGHVNAITSREDTVSLLSGILVRRVCQ